MMAAGLDEASQRPKPVRAVTLAADEREPSQRPVNAHAPMLAVGMYESRRGLTNRLHWYCMYDLTVACLTGCTDPGS